MSTSKPLKFVVFGGRGVGKTSLIVRFIIDLYLPDFHSDTDDNVNWTLSDGTLRIYGTGSMNNYTSSNQPWKNNRTLIKTIIIEENVTSIGNYAFYLCTQCDHISQ